MSPLLTLLSHSTQAHGLYEAKGSKFMSVLLHISAFDECMSTLREEHTKAVHFVSATRTLNEHSQILESFDDDREPRGSSGMPSLKVLRGEGLINVGIIIVRYFGGTLLGMGGLVRAYTSATQAAIESAKSQNLLHEFIPLSHFECELPYPMLSRAEYEARGLGIELKKLDFLAHGVRVRCEGEQSLLEIFRSKI